MSTQQNWVGDQNSIFTTLGASNHCKDEREQNDYYATSPEATKALLSVINFNTNILEPCCGEGHISEVLINSGYIVKSCDLIDRGYGEVKDFFTINKFDGDIITNPPYKFAKECVEHALDIIDSGNKVAMLLKIQFLEGQKRRGLFEKNPPKTVYVFSKRIDCAKNGDFNKKGSFAVCYAWYVWEKGFQGDTIIKWI